MAPSSPFSVRTRVCNNKCAPSLDHCICCFLQNRSDSPGFSGKISGSDIHLMLALCCRSRQVVMANEELHGPDMIGELLGKRQRRAYQPRNALSQRVVEPFDVIGCARSLADRFVLRCRNHLPQPRGAVLLPGACHVCMAAPGQPHLHPAQGGEAGAGVKRIGRVPPRPEGFGHLLQLMLGHPALLQG